MLKSIDEIGANKPLNPQNEQARINYTVANRRLYNGELDGLGIKGVDATTKAIFLNWFRRVSTFYPEFLFSELPDVTIENNAGMTEAFEEQKDHFMEVLGRASVDMLRYGRGVIATNPFYPTLFMQFERDQHYEVVDVFGNVTADILVTEDKTNEVFNFVVYPIDQERDGPARLVQYNAAAGGPGAEIRRVDLPARSGRQVTTMAHNPGLLSIFDDMKDPLLQMTRVRTGLAKTLKRNFSPHLYGPEDMLGIDEKGNAKVDADGMFLPVPEGENVTPGYLQWDSNVAAAKWDYSVNQEAIFTLSGLSPLLFDPDLQVGVLSGEALRRSLAPFLARLGVYARTNAKAIRFVLQIWNANRGVNGEEIFEYTPRDINIEWHYEEALGLGSMLEQPDPTPTPGE